MSYVHGEDRGQAALLPAAIEEYVAADAPVRVIDAFVDGLDVKGLGFGRSVPCVTPKTSGNYFASTKPNGWPLLLMRWGF